MAWTVATVGRGGGRALLAYYLGGREWNMFQYQWECSGKKKEIKLDSGQI